MKTLLLAILSLSVSITIAAGQQPPMALWEEDIDNDGDFDWIYRIFGSNSEGEWVAIYYASDPDGVRMDLPDPWIQWEANMDGVGDLDPVWRNFLARGRYYYTGDDGEDVVIMIPREFTLTPETRDLGNGTPSVRTLDPDGVPVWWHDGGSENWLRLGRENTSDHDEDGLTDYFEAELGTDPNNPDTDGDALPDGWELTHQMDPRVADLNSRDHLKSFAFPTGEPSIEIGRDHSVVVRGAVSESFVVLIQVSENLKNWRDAGAFEGGELRFVSPLPAGYVRLVVRAP